MSPEPAAWSWPSSPRSPPWRCPTTTGSRAAPKEDGQHRAPPKRSEASAAPPRVVRPLAPSVVRPPCSFVGAALASSLCRPAPAPCTSWAPQSGRWASLDWSRGRNRVRPDQRSVANEACASRLLWEARERAIRGLFCGAPLLLYAPGASLYTHMETSAHARQSVHLRKSSITLM